MARILVVEDNEQNKTVVKGILTRLGFQLLFAENGRVGIDIASTEKPDLILMDMSLPVMDGWEATQAIKAAPETRNIPVIGLSAHAMMSAIEKAEQCGCDAYVTKPIDMGLLARTIAEHIGDQYLPPAALNYLGSLPGK